MAAEKMIRQIKNTFNSSLVPHLKNLHHCFDHNVKILVKMDVIET